MIIATFLFFCGVEFYKFCKRAFFRRTAKKIFDSEHQGAESKMFARYLSTDSSGLDEKEKD